MKTKESPLTVVSTGICTPVGINALMMTRGAALHDVAFAETDVSDRRGEPIRASYLPLLDSLADRTQRMCFLTESAAEEVFSSFFPQDDTPLPVFIGLPEEIETYCVEAITAAIQKVNQNNPPLHFSENQLFFNGRASFFHALSAASHALNSGKSNHTLVGAVDSLCDPISLQRLSEQKRISGDTRDGLLPGEGAGFFILSLKPGRQRIIHTTLSEEPFHFSQREPSLFNGLSQAFKKLTHHPITDKKRVHRVLSSQTGEDYWNREFTTAYLRNAALMPEPLNLASVSESHGDIGAATGSILLGMSLDSVREEVPPNENYRILIYSSSDKGAIGASIIESDSVLNQSHKWFESQVIKQDPQINDYFETHFENHLEEVGWLLRSRHRDIHEHNEPWSHFSNEENRIFKHLDALTAAGSKTLKSAFQHLESSDKDIVSGVLFTIPALIPEKNGFDSLIPYFKQTPNTMLDTWILALKHTPTLDLNNLPVTLPQELSPRHLTALTEVMAYRASGNISFLLAILNDGNISGKARHFAATALSRMNVTEAKTPLFEALKENPGASAIAFALTLLGERKTILNYCRFFLQKQSDPEMRSAFFSLMAMAGDDSDDALLLEVGKTDVEKIKMFGILGLGKTLPILIEALDSKDPAITKASADSLERMTAAGLTEEEILSDEDPDFKETPESRIMISRDSNRWHEWFRKNQTRFEENRRYRQGEPFTLEVCLEEIENPNLPYAVRQLAALEMNIRSEKNICFEADAFEHIQRKAIVGWK